MNVLILGGTGLISRNIVASLLDRGDTVTVVNRGQRPSEHAGDIEQITLDRKDDGAFRSQLGGRKFDAVIDMICFSREEAEQTLQVLAPNTDQLIICSTVAAYKRPYITVPTREDTEELATDPVFGYSFHKAEMERYLWKQMREENIPLTIVRPSLTFGRGAVNVGTLRQNYNLVQRIKDGKPLVLFGDGHHPWSFSFAPDVGRAIAGLAGKAKALGEAFHVSSEERTEWRDLYLEIGRIVGRTPELVSIPSSMLYGAMPDFCAHLYFEKSHPGLFDNSKRLEVTGDTVSYTIGLRKGMEMVIDSWEQQGAVVDAAKDKLEDDLAAAAAGFQKSLSGIQTLL